MKRQVTIASLISLFLVFQPDGRAQTTASDFEPGPVLTVADLVPAVLARGDRHALVVAVRMEGYQAVFDIQSAYGNFHAPGREILSLRLAEFPAIEALGRIHKGEAFADALGRAAKAPLDFVGKLISAPSDTLGSVAAGVGNLVGKAGSVVRSGVDSVADSVSDLTNANVTSPTAASTVEQEPPSFGSDPFGYNKARRMWAKTLNVDPYSSNPVLRQLLDEAASATFAGSFAVDTTLGVVAAPVKFVVGMDTDSRDAVWDLSPGDIELRLEARLKVMGIEGRPVRDLFRNRWFTPTLQTGLVSALEDLQGVNGRAAVIELAARVQGEARVRSLIETLRLLADHHRQAPLDDLRLHDALLVASRKDGGLVVAIAADYLFWNAAAADLSTRPELAAPRRTLLVSGKASARVRAEMERAGWVLIESGSPRAQAAGPPAV